MAETNIVESYLSMLAAAAEDVAGRSGVSSAAPSSIAAIRAIGDKSFHSSGFVLASAARPGPTLLCRRRSRGRPPANRPS